MPITVVKPTAEQMADMQRRPVWEKEISTFDWYYDEPETFLLITGDVTISTPAGEWVTCGPGDLVTCPSGLECTWEVTAPVRKHYKMG